MVVGWQPFGRTSFEALIECHCGLQGKAREKRLMSEPVRQHLASVADGFLASSDPLWASRTRTLGKR